MPKNNKGIYIYTETDDAPTFSELINLGFQSASDTLKHFSGTPAQRYLLDPAPEGAFWVDTDPPGRVWRGIGGVWVPLGNDRILGVDMGAQKLATTEWLTIASVTAISQGREVIASGMAWAFNGGSGADRAVTYRITCDDVAISPLLAGTQPIPLLGAPRVPGMMGGKSTPAKGAHTWKLQISASANLAVYAEASMLTVTERGM